ncbi:MAG: PD40 domain-containing protein [Acidobacteria bacterium]|nr:PD40 domain-containing protein [Acidobacteriota bacterium]
MTGPSPVRFGAFELDLHTGELRKHGIRLKLQDQPFHVLRILVERPGELVTREELQHAVWGDSTFVDFDQSLNRAINKVREALSDTADNPRYIETMARRGYRFIAPVDGVQKSSQPMSASTGARHLWLWIGAVAAGVLVVAGAGLWLTRDHAPQPAPRLVQLTTYPGDEAAPAFSPDGKRLVFAWNGEARDNFDVYTRIVESVTPLRLTSDPAFDGYPAWSPDGRHIAFFSDRDGGGIYLVSADGGPQRKLAALLTYSHLAWTADGKYLVVAALYREKPQRGDGALWLVPVEGEGTPRQFLTPPDGTWYRHPALAPHGGDLAFTSCTGAPRGPRCTLLVVHLYGSPVSAGSPRQIATTPVGITGIAWTRDSSSLVFSSGATTTSTFLWRVKVTGGKPPEKLDMFGSSTYWPAIDFTTGRLAFTRSLSSAGICRLTLGGKLESFLSSSGASDSSPQYSPDGRRIAFQSNRQVANNAVWVANADGTGSEQITNIASSHSGTPRWSPDGRSIAFDALREGGGWDIWTLAADGGSPRRVTLDKAVNAVPSWSRDGSSIYYASNRSGRFEIWRSPAGGGPAAQITRNGGYTAFESTDGKKLYYTVSERGDEGLYAKVLPDGEEKQVVKENVAFRGFAVFDDGVFYLHWRTRNIFEIRFYQFAGGNARTIADVAGNLHIGFAVSPDRKTFLFTKYTDVGSDLMLIENFR